MLTNALCYALAVGFLMPPLKRFGFRTSAITRFDSNENYVADRVSAIGDYARLFDSFVSFKGKTVLELGCSKGYLLHNFWHSPVSALNCCSHHWTRLANNTGTISSLCNPHRRLFQSRATVSISSTPLIPLST